MNDKDNRALKHFTAAHHARKDGNKEACSTQVVCPYCTQHVKRKKFPAHLQGQHAEAYACVTAAFAKQKEAPTLQAS